MIKFLFRTALFAFVVISCTLKIEGFKNGSWVYAALICVTSVVFGAFMVAFFVNLLNEDLEKNTPTP